MNIFEKILVVIHLFFILVHFTFFDFEISFYMLSNWALVFFYCFFGYWILYKNGGSRIIAVVSGFIFALALYPVPYCIWLQNTNVYLYFPIANILLFILLFYFFVYLKTKEEQLKMLFYRSLIMLFYSSFFIFSSIYSKPFREVVYHLNSGNVKIQKNILMFDYLIKSETALEKGDCDEAINSGLKSMKNGCSWLGLSINLSGGYFNSEDSSGIFKVSITPSQDNLSYINGVFSNLYNAYRCKADNYYSSSQYDLALENYLMADAYLNLYSNFANSWESMKSFSKRDIALCYEGLNEYDLSDSVFREAIDIYYNVNDTLDSDSYSILINYSELLTKKYENSYSNDVLDHLLQTLTNDAGELIYSKDVYRVNKNQVSNFLRLGMYDTALNLIEAIESNFIDSSFFDCNIFIYEGVCYYRKNEYNTANTVLENNISCLKNNSTDFNLSENYRLLSYTNIALAHYQKAKDYVVPVKDYVLSKKTKTSTSYASCLKIEAEIANILGNYQDALKMYDTVENIYQINYGNDFQELSEVYMFKARAQIVLGNFDEAEILLSKAIEIMGDYNIVDNPLYSFVLDDIAYVNYYLGHLELSEQVYTKVLELNLDSSGNVSKASVFNGVALVNVERGELAYADSLFLLSKVLHEEIYTVDHPLTASVYLNYSDLKLKQDSLEKAEYFMLESLRINKLFFDETHDVFANIYSSLGDLELLKANKANAIEFYLKASTIYSDKFSEDYFKQISIRNKIKAIKG